LLAQHKNSYYTGTTHCLSASELEVEHDLPNSDSESELSFTLSDRDYASMMTPANIQFNYDDTVPLR
jgi:hypothetical protein